MARSIFCSKCKKEKEPGRDNESCCKACKSEAGKARRAAKRLEAGLRPIGSGPNPNCKCGKVKERIQARECNECHRKRDNEWRLRTGRTKKHQTGKCPCGAERASYNPTYCKDCANKQKNKWLSNNPRTPEQRARINELQNKRYIRKRDPDIVGTSYTSESHKIKARVRALTRSYIIAGKLIKRPCEVCGTTEIVEAHHDDYCKPMDIRWLCKTHHHAHHVSERKRMRESGGFNILTNWRV